MKLQDAILMCMISAKIHNLLDLDIFLIHRRMETSDNTPNLFNVKWYFWVDLYEHIISYLLYLKSQYHNKRTMFIILK